MHKMNQTFVVSVSFLFVLLAAIAVSASGQTSPVPSASQLLPSVTGGISD